MDNTENLLRPILLLWKHKLLIAGITLLCSLLAVVILLIKPNYYQSSALFYPASTDLAKPLPIGNQSQKMLYYGDSDDLDRLFSIAKSNELKGMLIEEFDLYNHYEIESNQEKSEYYMDLKLNKLFTTEKTKYDALKLSVEDKDPQFAQKMASRATELLNTIAQKVVKQSQATLLDSYSKNIELKSQQLQVLSDSIAKMRSLYGIYDLENQSMSYAELWPKTKAKQSNLSARYNTLKSDGAPRDTLIKVKAQLDGITSQARTLEESMNKFNTGYIKVLTADTEQESFMKQLGLDKQRYSQLEAALNSPYNAIHLVQQAELPKIKSRPKRTFIVLGVAFAAGLFSCLLVLLKDLFGRLPKVEV